MRDESGRDDAEYARISLDRRGAAEGVETQRAENADAAGELGLVIARSYVDNDLSAFSGVERPEYGRLLADIAADRIGTLVIWHANRLHRSTEEVNAFIKLARAHRVRLYSTAKGAFYNLEKASGRKELRDDTSEAEYESEHCGERVAIARKRQARQGAYGGGVRPYGWGVDTGRVRSVCVNPKAPPMDRVYEDRMVLDMTRHNEAETAEIRRWADDLLSGVSMNQVLRDLAARKVPTVAMTDERTVRRSKSGTPVYRCRARGHCQWPAGRVDAHVESVIVERLSKPDVADLLPREAQVDVAALRGELIVTEARKNGAAQMYARGTIDAGQLETITAETEQAIGKIRAELSAATDRSSLADFAASEDARRTWNELTLGRKREVLRHLITVTLPPLGRGRTFNRDLIQIGPATPPGSLAAY